MTVKTIVLASAVLATSLVGATAMAKGGDRVRLQCAADGASDFSMSARYETRGGRAKFDASFEAAPRTGYVAGQNLDVYVGGVRVGSMNLALTVGGDLEGDLEFDTRADENNPFPANFPSVAAGAGVTVGTLGCSLD